MIRGFQNSAAISILYKGTPLWVIIAGRKPGGPRKLDHEQHLIYCETVPRDCCISCFTMYDSSTVFPAVPSQHRFPETAAFRLKLSFRFVRRPTVVFDKSTLLAVLDFASLIINYRIKYIS